MIFFVWKYWSLIYIPVSSETEGELRRGRWGKGVVFFISDVDELVIIKEERPTVRRAEMFDFNTYISFNKKKTKQD